MRPPAQRTEELAEAWRELGLSRVPLDLVECPDRRLARRVADLVADELTGGETEVTVLLPDRKYKGFWHRILHDQTAEAIEREASRLPHANVTTVPFHFDLETAPLTQPGRSTASEPLSAPVARPGGNGEVPIANVAPRLRVVITGRVTTLRVRPLRDVPTLECTIDDGSGTISVVFLGRRQLPGVRMGTHLRVEGTTLEQHGRITILNPIYEIQAAPTS